MEHSVSFAVVASSRKFRFRQINLDQPTMHHDALEFPDGEIVLVTELREGQHATVLQLPAPERASSEAAPTERVPVSTMA